MILPAGWKIFMEMKKLSAVQINDKIYFYGISATFANQL